MFSLIMFLFLFQATFRDPPPIGVPPITEEYGAYGFEICDMGQCSFIKTDKPTEKSEWGALPMRKTHTTCADKTRFLMTSEDGKSHCIKLN